MSFHRLDLPAMHISAWDNLKDISDQNFVVVNVQDNELANFDHFGTHPYLLELDVRRNKICNFLGLTRQASLRTLHLSGNIIVEHPYYRIMALLVIGFSLSSIDGVDVSEEEVMLAKSIPSHAALAVSYGWLLDLQPRSPQSFQHIISDCQRIRAHHRRQCKGQFTIQHALNKISSQLIQEGENVSNNQVNMSKSMSQEIKDESIADVEHNQLLLHRENQWHGSNAADENRHNEHTLDCNQQLHDLAEHESTEIYFTNAEVQTISCFTFDDVCVEHITKQSWKTHLCQWQRCKLELSSTKVTIIMEGESNRSDLEFTLSKLIVEEEESKVLRITTEKNTHVRLLFNSTAQMTAALKCFRLLQCRLLQLSSYLAEQRLHGHSNEENNKLPLSIQQQQEKIERHPLQLSPEAETAKTNNCNTCDVQCRAYEMQHVNDDKSSVEEIEFEVEEETEEEKLGKEPQVYTNTLEGNEHVYSNETNITKVKSNSDDMLPCVDDENNNNKDTNVSRRNIFATHLEANDVNDKDLFSAFTIDGNNNVDNSIENANNNEHKSQTENVDERSVFVENTKSNTSNRRHGRIVKQVRHRRQKAPESSGNAHYSSDSSAPNRQDSSAITTELSTKGITQRINASYSNNVTSLPAPPISLPRRAADKAKEHLSTSSSPSLLETFLAHDSKLQAARTHANITTTKNSGNFIGNDKAPEVPFTRSLHNSFATSFCNEQKATVLAKPSTPLTQLSNKQIEVVPIITDNSNNNNNVNKLTNTSKPFTTLTTTEKALAQPHHQQLRHQEFRNIVITSDSD